MAWTQVLYYIDGNILHKNRQSPHTGLIYGSGRGAFTAEFPEVDPVRACAGFISRCDLLQKCVLSERAVRASGLVRFPSTAAHILTPVVRFDRWLPTVSYRRWFWNVLFLSNLSTRRDNMRKPQYYTLYSTTASLNVVTLKT